MRIQHNIPAMSAYRNYTANVSSVQKNLEKLSSGYRINRAGDDAAGLAISEKMRAQISGLEQAQSNAKSGINLVQTGEGALTEVHDMLNRMYTLAEQSANGTYDNDVDRVQLQKEVDSLRKEINRIADSTNFNGIKLLDGSLANGATAAVKGKASNFTFEGAGAGVLAALKDPGGINNGGTVLHKEAAKGSDETSFGVAFHNTQITGDAGDTFTLTIGETTLTGTLTGTAKGDTAITAADLATALSTGTSGKFTLKVGDEAYDKGNLEIGGAKYAVTADGTENVKITLNKGEEVPEDVAFDIALAVGTDVSTGQAPRVNAIPGKAAAATDPTVSGGTDGEFASSNSTNGTSTQLGSFDVDLTGIKLTDGASKLTLTINGQTVDSGPIAADKKEDAGAIAAAFNDKTIDLDGAGKTFKISVTGNKLTFTQQGTPSASSAITLSGIGAATFTATKTAATNGTVVVDFGTKTGAEVIGSSITIDGKTYSFFKSGGTDPSNGDVVGVGIAENATAAQMASALKTATDTAGKKGDNVATVAVGTDPNTNKVTFTADGDAGADSKLEASESSTEAVEVAVTGQYNWKAINQKVKTEGTGDQLAQTSFTLTKEMAADGASIRIGETEYTFTTDAAKKDDDGMVYVGDLDTATQMADVAERLTAAAAGNTTYSVGQDGEDSATITLTEQTTYTTGKQKYDLSTPEGIAKSLGFTTAGTKADDGDPTKGLTLQIGDTADDYNKLTVAIKDMHADAMGIGDIDISKQDLASDAMAKIKEAINYVSDVRGTLGALQNRLDHTINNLSVAQENIQDAESTIRDVDIAKEMMAYTKNNILVQSAQAMLAQANQLPQGVLQLLG